MNSTFAPELAARAPAGALPPRAVPTAARYQHLDALRGAAALAVCGGHLRHFLFVEWADVQAPTLATKLFYALTALGHAAVMIFFVLSGYLVGGSVWQQISVGRWSWKKYAVRRLARLWVVLGPALLLTAGWDTLGKALGGTGGYAGEFFSAHSSGPSPGLPANHTWTAALGNFFFLQTIATDVFGSNGPLWSLANEFWYYVLFPLAVWAVKGAGFRAVSLGLLAALLWFLPGALVQAGAIWLLGVAAYLLSRHAPMAARLNRHSVAAGLVVLLLISLAGHVAHRWYGADGFIGLWFALLLPWIVLRPAWGGRWAAFAQTSGDLSYTLYLTHFPFLAFLLWSGGTPLRLQPDAAGLAIFLALGLATLVYAVAVWWLFERNTDVLRNRLETWLLTSNVPSPSA